MSIRPYLEPPLLYYHVSYMEWPLIFFNISGSLFVETTTDASIRSSAQGLFMMMTNGVGAWLGSTISGYVIGKYFLFADGSTNWHSTWLAFAGYSLVIAILFFIFFKHKHDPNAIVNVQH